MRFSSLWLLLAFSYITSPAVGKIVINEILYRAPDDLDVEFVELHNSGDAAVSIAGWKFTAGITYTFPSNATIDGGAYLILSHHRGLLKEFSGVDSFDEFRGSLANGGETLTLSDHQGSVVDSVKYDDSAPWPLSADGHSSSLERVCPSAPGKNPANWVPSPPSDDTGTKPGGTPGAKNRGFSSSLPPVITAMPLASTVRRPGEAIKVEAIVEPSGSPLASVELLFRAVQPGNEGNEIAVPMESRGAGRFRASVPGQPGNRIVRIRVRATDQAGAVRYDPPPYERRPARSVWVGDTVTTGKIPVVEFVNVGADEFTKGQAYLQNQRQPRGRGGFRGFPRISENDRLKMDAERKLSSDALERAWAGLVFDPSWSTKNGAALATAFRTAEAALVKLRAELAASREVSEFAKALPERLRVEGSKLLSACEKAVGAGKLTTESRELLQRFGAEGDDGRGGDRGGDRGQRGGSTVERAFNVSRSLFRTTILIPVTSEQLTRLVRLHREAHSQRKVLELALEFEETDVRDVLDHAGDLQDGLRDAAAAVLTTTQRKSVEDDPQNRDRGPDRGRERGPDRGRDRGRGGRGGFGRFGSRPSTPLPFPARSAFLYTDPKTQETQLFDFVHVVERKSGYKVRLHKDRPLRGATTLNILYESDERSILTEALAYDLYRSAGNATPDAGYVRVLIDGKLAGHHLIFEQPNGAFFRRQKRSGGDLYKIIWMGSNRASRHTPPDKVPERQDIVGRHEKKTNAHDGYVDLVTLVETLEKTDDADELWKVIQKHFDVDQVINYFAVNTLLSHWDGFFNNYFLYHDAKGSGKWSLYPWDQDSTWGHRMSRGGGGVFAEMPLTFGMAGDVSPGADPNSSGRGGRFGGFRGGPGWWRAGGEISKPLLANPQFRKRFLSRLEELAKNVYTEEVFGPKIDALRDQLEGEVRLRAKASGRSEEDALRRFGESLDFFREHLTKRRAFILTTLAKESAGQ